MRFKLLTILLLSGTASSICPKLQAAIPVVARPTSPPTSTLPVVRAVTPLSGPVGTRITITGSNLAGVVAVDFGEQSTSPLSRSANSLVVLVPPGARSGRLTVRTANESAKSSFQFTITASPRVDEFFPRSAPVGANVTISGVELNSTSAVRFGNVSASVISRLPNQIIVRVPVGARSGPITVFTTTLKARSREPFEVAPPPRQPKLDDFSPASARAGTSITLFGEHLSGAREVRFGTVRTTDFVVVSDDVLKVIVPAGIAPGPVTLSVATGNGTAQSDRDFSVLAPSPTTFSIAGRITNSSGLGLLGVRVTRSANGRSTTVLTNAAGNYVFTDVAAGSYTLTPELNGVIFKPLSRVVTIARSVATGVNFSGAAIVQKFSLGGRVTVRGAGLGGVTISRRRDGVVLDSTVSDAAGYYSFAQVLGGNYTLSAAKSGFSFSPPLLAGSLGANRSDANFAASTIIRPPANDAFANARLLSGASGRASNSATGATAEAGEPAHAGNQANASIWFRWTAPSNGIATFDTFGSNYDTTLSVYSGSALTSLNAVTANDDADDATGSSRVAFTATRGKTYQIAVDGFSSGAANVVLNYRLVTPNATPTPTPATAPDNDLFARAKVLSGASGRVTGSNVNAGREVGEPGTHRDASVWYRWSAPNNGTATFSTAGSTFDTALAAYTGASVNALRLVASNDDDDGVGTSEISFSVRRGVIYQIAVGGFNNARGTIMLSYSFRAAPANDDIVAARLLTGPKGRASGTNLHATSEAIEPAHGGVAARHSVWFLYNAASPGAIHFSTENSNFTPRLGAYRRAANGALVAVGSDDGSGFVQFATERGVTYYIAVDGQEDQTGTFDLVWSSNFQLRVQLTSERTTAEGINVYLNSDNYTDTATTNDDGVAVFNNVPTGRYSVMPESVPVFATIASPASQSVNLTGEAFLSFAILGPYALSGRVVDEKGVGVADVNITIRDGKYFVDNLYTDAAGYYTYATLPPGSYTLTPTSPNGASIEPTAKSVNIERANITGIDFVVYGPFTISGRLLDDKGAPVANRTVALKRDGQILEDALTDGAGNYAFVNTVAAGTYTINVVPDDPNSRPEPAARTVGVERADVAGVDFLILGPFTISGRVLNESGAPFPAVGVLVTDSAGKEIAVEYSDASGVYSFQNAVGPGTYTVSVIPPFGSTADVISRSISIERSDIANVDFSLRPTPTETNRNAQSTSSARLSTALAGVSRAAITLIFTAALNAKNTAISDNFDVAINGKAVAIQSTSMLMNGCAITLHVPDDALHVGDTVTANWRNLRDSKGRSLKAGSTSMTAH